MCPHVENAIELTVPPLVCVGHQLPGVGGTIPVAQKKKKTLFNISIKINIYVYINKNLNINIYNFKKFVLR